ncbi:MAG TPA: SRPBCC family protein [Dehalococcoidia bacterium]|nr:SRPBCC family protein [Dehalococcoidia bacterium]
MAAYYTSQAYDAPASVIWPVLTDFPAWPEWFPRVTSVRLEGAPPRRGAEILAVGEAPDVWTRWQITEWREPALLVCEHLDSNTPVTAHVQAAYLRFGLEDDPEGCTLEVELGADGYGIVGDFFLGVTMRSEVRRLLPELIDAFSDYVVRRVAAAR